MFDTICFILFEQYSICFSCGNECSIGHNTTGVWPKTVKFMPQAENIVRQGFKLRHWEAQFFFLHYSMRRPMSRACFECGLSSNESFMFSSCRCRASSTLISGLCDPIRREKSSGDGWTANYRAPGPLSISMSTPYRSLTSNSKDSECKIRSRDGFRACGEATQFFIPSNNWQDELSVNIWYLI